MSLLDQSLWWIAPYALLMLLMVHAMIEFTVSLLAQRPHGKTAPLAADALRQRLLAEAALDPTRRLAAGQDCDLEIAWRDEQPARPGRWAISKASSRTHIRLLLDEQRHELRLNEASRSFYYFLGLVGWLPVIRGFAGAQSGPPGAAITQEVARIANRYGWSVRPVVWWFQATHRGYRLLEALTPVPLRRWPARRFWGLLYPLNFFLGMAYIVLIMGGLDWRGMWVLAGVSAGWWGVWGLLVWAMRGFPAFWRR